MKFFKFMGTDDDFGCCLLLLKGKYSGRKLFMGTGRVTDMFNRRTAKGAPYNKRKIASYDAKIYGYLRNNAKEHGSYFVRQVRIFSDGKEISMVRKISCKNCGKVLMEADIKVGIIIKDCPKCGKKNVYEFSAKSKKGSVEKHLEVPVIENIAYLES